MIVLVEGTLGSGKTYYALRLIDDALGAGRPVATNVDLAPDALLRAAGAHPIRRFMPTYRRRRAEALSRSVLVETDDLAKLMRVRLHGSGESRGLMVLDESHNWMNARSWTQKDRDALIRFFSQSRKLGWDVYLIAQKAEMIDKQVRNLAEYQVSLKNLQKFRKMGVRLPFSLFVAIWRWNAHADRTIIRRDVYRLDKRVAGMYDTMATSHGLTLDGEPDSIWLPRDAGRTDAVAPAGPAIPGQLDLVAELADGAPEAPCLTSGERSDPGVSDA